LRVFSSVARLWRHEAFRRLLLLRIVTQTADGCVQVGLASYVLFSPYQQPNGWSIAAVLALTLLPFSVLGPFVSTVLDRWSRRQILVITDSARVVFALTIGVIVGSGDRSAPMQYTLAGVALIALSANRFLLAAISAAMAHTVNPDEYLSANTVMPLVGPLGAVIGGGVVFGSRFILSKWLPVYEADAFAFLLAGAGFATSAFLASRFSRRALGPDHRHHHTAADVLRGLMAAIGHLAHHRPAALGLGMIGIQRVLWGLAMVGTILIYRNHFHTVSDVNAAMADLSIWALATGIGFFAASAVTPPMAARFGVRHWMIALTLLSAIFQAFPGSVFQRVTLVAASFLLGVASQSFKICTDTLVQAHIEDSYKGRVFVLYDMIFNASMVVAAVIAAFVLPADGVSVPIFLGLAVAYLVLALAFTLVSRHMGATTTFDRGTESMRGPAVEPVS
jgi:MFS family permease